MLVAALFALLPALVSASPVQRANAQRIIAGRDGLCLGNDPAAFIIENGTPVRSVPCGSGAAGVWDISPGSGLVRYSGSNFCLDAGSNPGNNGALKFWTCYPGLYQQTWYLTDDKRIAITGGNQCLDEGSNGIQTYQCTTGNTNQIFNVVPFTGPTSSSKSAGPTSSSSKSAGPTSSSKSAGPTSSASKSSSSTSSTSNSATPTPSSGVSPNLPPGTIQPNAPAGRGRQIRAYGRPDLCLTVQNGYAGIGSSVAISYCFDPSSEFINNQLWDYPAPGSAATGPIQLHNSGSSTPLCLDFGSNPGNGIGAKVWTCYPGVNQQTFRYRGDDHIALLDSSQCLDITLGSQPRTQKPYNSVEDVQSWACADGNTQQRWELLK